MNGRRIVERDRPGGDRNHLAGIGEGVDDAGLARRERAGGQDNRRALQPAGPCDVGGTGDGDIAPHRQEPDRAGVECERQRADETDGGVGARERGVGREPDRMAIRIDGGDRCVGRDTRPHRQHSNNERLRGKKIAHHGAVAHRGGRFGDRVVDVPDRVAVLRAGLHKQGCSAGQFGGCVGVGRPAPGPGGCNVNAVFGRLGLILHQHPIAGSEQHAIDRLQAGEHDVDRRGDVCTAEHVGRRPNIRAGGGNAKRQECEWRGANLDSVVAEGEALAPIGSAGSDKGVGPRPQLFFYIGIASADPLARGRHVEAVFGGVGLVLGENPIAGSDCLAVDRLADAREREGGGGGEPHGIENDRSGGRHERQPGAVDDWGGGVAERPAPLLRPLDDCHCEPWGEQIARVGVGGPRPCSGRDDNIDAVGRRGRLIFHQHPIACEEGHAIDCLRAGKNDVGRGRHADRFLHGTASLHQRADGGGVRRGVEAHAAVAAGGDRVANAEGRGGQPNVAISGRHRAAQRERTGGFLGDRQIEIADGPDGRAENRQIATATGAGTDPDRCAAGADGIDREIVDFLDIHRVGEGDAGGVDTRIKAQIADIGAQIDVATGRLAQREGDRAAGDSARLLAGRRRAGGELILIDRTGSPQQIGLLGSVHAAEELDIGVIADESEVARPCIGGIPPE